MKILGLDASINSTGIVCATLDDNELMITGINYCGFTSVKRNRSANVILYGKFKSDMAKYLWMRNKIFEITGPVDYVAFEDYAYGGSGLVLNIAEYTALLKEIYYLNGSKIRLYDIKGIKKFATGDGNADKIRMNDEFNKWNFNSNMDISKLPDYKSPKLDIIDAYYIMRLLQTELQLRRGLIQLRNMAENRIWAFNRVTKHAKENVLTREFIER